MLVHFKRLDWILIVVAILLVGIGFLSIYSSSLGKGDFLNFKKQVIFFGIGFFLMIILSFFDWRELREDPYLVLILYLICLFSLAGLFFFAPEIRGVRSWYKVGPISIDPIEFTKIVLIILLAKYFSKRHIEMYQVRHIFLSGFYLLLPAILIFLQPDLGQVIILIAFWVGVLLISGIKLRHFLILILCFLLIFILSWNFLLKDYQKERILSFLIPFEPLGVSWSQNQAKIAIGSGGIFGQGIGKGSQTQYGFLPEPQTDFIFSAIAEEMGLIGVSVLLFLFSILLWRIIKIAIDSQSNFSRLFASGFSILLISQIFIHIGMNLGISPIIGIPLPLISYGGSSLIAIFIGLGILQSIKTR
ncbi:MAG: rod shape-determining protein RodA [Candidatus Nealsonbacteria bacterium CG_4_8_14_3_um_filter_37_36]|uniref:Rod shape-determining protein RodA n=3 Tax=Candidatus Nealsoniibacteriota TaxID=1817911 RepID=A0A2M7EC05_9BACT|nr:MAG: rod shape-determining protein RodA [Candidatus Nealsonbacteria bacterium CG01_land_8_20_14_3_00_12]PIW91651.1 MAG: rod shape-determining protein RodA [Candidatus Nealsonbacteria bacterium CG_4_8_14_3_um_filter_37_36]PJA83429.1 MAG: rod shape-determining protein RodA [Candidatus Nealsonbacteria bacterium CG_4_9_14_3_um_filter_37_29]